MSRSCFIVLLFLFPVLICCNSKGISHKKNKTDSPCLDPYIPSKPLGWTSDFENIFTLEQVSILDSIIGKNEAETSNEMAIITLNLDTAKIKSEAQFNSFSLDLFNCWGVGKKEKNNGVAILVSPNLRRIRIETGYGLESKLTNQEAKYIIDSIIIPEFKKANYFEGVRKGVFSIIAETK